MVRPCAYECVLVSTGQPARAHSENIFYFWFCNIISNSYGPHRQRAAPVVVHSERTGTPHGAEHDVTSTASFFLLTIAQAVDAHALTYMHAWGVPKER